MNSLKLAFLHLWAFLTGLGEQSLTYVETTVVPVLKTDAGALIIQLAPIALSVVTEIAKTGDLPNAKRDAAVSQLENAAIAAGISAGASVLNKAVEDAYQQFKATAPATQPASVSDGK